MRKIVTPQQYSQTLDELNKIRPLQVVDIVKQSVDIGVCNSFADSGDKSVLGKLVRCTQHGSEIIHRLNSDENYELKEFPTPTSTGLINHSFAQPVKCLLVYVYELLEFVTFYWVDSTGLIFIQKLETLGTILLPFKGTEFYTKVSSLPPGKVSFNLYGFY